MNMFARFDENPAMTLQDIKKTKRYGRTHTRTDNVKTVYPPQTKFAGGIKHARTHTRTDVKTVYPPQTKFAGGIKICLTGTIRMRGPRVSILFAIFLTSQQITHLVCTVLIKSNNKTIFRGEIKKKVICINKQASFLGLSIIDKDM